MSAILGLAIASDELRAVLCRDGLVTWAARSGRTVDRDLTSQVSALLAQAPVTRWAGLTVAAAIGPSASQVRRISGLPPVPGGAQLGALVRESASRLFLRNGIPLETTNVRTDASGAMWSAALEQPTVSALERACRDGRVRLRAIMPAAVALAAAYGDAEMTWADGDVRLEVKAERGTIVHIRRSVSSGHAIDAPLLASLGGLGGDGWRFADAYGATLVPTSEPLVLRATTPAEAASTRRRVVRAAAAAACAALIALMASPAASVSARVRADRQLDALANRSRTASMQEHELRRVSAALSEVSAFRATRRPITALLAHLAKAMPDGDALVSLRLDSASGTIVMLSAHAASEVSRLNSLRDIVEPEVVGPVTREVVGTREMERATVRFAFAKERP